MRFFGTFEPQIHPERLEAPAHTKPNRNIPGKDRVFVGSMADLFGDWVPEEWIQKVLAQVEKHSEWTFLFLTKNPARYAGINFPKNAWIGATVDTQARVKPTEDAMDQAQAAVKFVSCEPLLESVVFSRPELFDWFLIGSKSEGAKKVQPDSRWTQGIIAQARGAGKKVWLKDNLTPLDDQPLIQESPEPEAGGGDHAMTDDMKGYSYCRDYLPGGIPTPRYYRDPKGDRIDDPKTIERLDALFSDRIEKEKGIQEPNEEPNDLLTLRNRLFGIKTDA